MRPWLTPDSAWHRIFTLELRSIRFFRIALGILCLIDLAQRFYWHTDFMGQHGILQWSAIEGLGLSSLQTWSIHYYVADIGLLGLTFFVHSLCCLAFTLGWRTKLSGLATWILLISLHNRTPFIQYGADSLLRMLFLWSLFLPLDRQKTKVADQDQKIFSLGSIGLTLQVILVYFTTVMTRTSPIWHSEQSALYFIFNIDQQVSWLGKYLLNYPNLLATGTSVTLAAEFIAPLLILFPWHIRYVRSAIIIGMCALHLGIASTMNLYWFAAVSICSWIPLIPRTQIGSKQSYCFLKQGFLADSLAVLALISMLGYNVAQWKKPPERVTVPYILKPFVYLPRIDQEWKLYAPYPYKDDGWLLVKFTTQDQMQFSVEGLPGVAGTQKPRHLADYFPDGRWMKLIFNVWRYRSTDLPRSLAHYFCGKIQSYTHDSPLSVNVEYMLENTPDPGQQGTRNPQALTEVVCNLKQPPIQH